MPESYFSEKVALVTGSSRGLGRAYAEKLAQKGATVILHARTNESASYFGEAESGEKVAQEFRDRGYKAKFMTADLRIPEEVKKLIDDIVKEFGRIDILVNNAGGNIGVTSKRPVSSSAIDIEIDDMMAIVSRNLISTMLTCKYAGFYMRTQNSGKIINISSQAAHIPAAKQAIYAAAKAGIGHYTRCLAEELRPNNIHVNCLAVGAVYTGRILQFNNRINEEGLSPLQRFHSPDEMANIVLFLAGPESDGLTGETIVCWGK